MFDDLNTTYLGDTIDEADDGGKTMVKVSHVSMVFNMANEKLNSLKEYAIALMRRELRFKEFRALDDVSFEVKKGDVFGILGTNGSGKSTMLKIIAGVLEPTEGTREVNGNMAPLIELGAGFDMELTARENVYLNGALLGYPKKFIAQHFDEIIEFAEIEQFLDMPLKNYSSGMVARIAFAIATVIVPEILIVDEVLSVGDFMFQQKCERRISDLIKNHGVTVLIVSHSNDQIERLCNKAIWIEKGHTRMMGPASEVCAAYRVVGGRGGTTESETRVIDAMRIELDDPGSRFSAITGATRFSTAVEIADGYYSTQRTAVITNTDSFKDCILGTAIGGLARAVLLNTEPERLPGVTEQMLKRMEPSQGFVMGAPEFVTAAAEEELGALAGGNVRRLGIGGMARSSLEAYELGRDELGGWGSTAIVALGESTIALVTLSGYIYGAHAPVFFLEEPGSPDEALNAKVVDAVASAGFERVVFVGPAAGMPEGVVERIAASTGETVELFTDDELEMNAMANDWIDFENAKDGHDCARKLLVTTTWKPIDAYLIGPYLLAQDAQIMMGNPGNLDDTCKTFDFIEGRGGQIEELVFLGGPARYSNDDRKTLAKVMVRARRDAGREA